MDAPTKKTPKQKILERLAALKNERASWLEHWRDLSQHIQPRTGRFLSTDANRGEKRNQKIINSVATQAARTLSSGMMSGITSPARSWFRLTTPDPALDEVDTVRTWLHDVEQILSTIFSKSNIYKCLHTLYEDLGTPGTAAMHIEEDDEKVIRCFVFPIGQYCLATNEKGQVDTVYREMRMTCRQLVKMFGEPNCSTVVRGQYMQGNLDAWHDVIHIMEPNEDYVPGKIGHEGMGWRSCWLEAGGTEDKLLREGGYEEQPFVAPRWKTTGEDVYGSSPAMEALGDIRALQLLEKRAQQAFDKVVNPPMRAPASLQNFQTSLVPGDVTYTPDSGGNMKFEPAMEISPAALQAFELKIERHERRIEAAFYADVWKTITAQNGQMTATEVVARQQEQMLMLGPVMETLSDELLDLVISRTFQVAFRRGLIPEAPEELQGQDLKVEYTSIMASAQKMLGTQGVERLTGFVANLAQFVPAILDKVDFDQTVDEMSTMLLVPPSIVRSDDVVAQRRAQQQQQQAQQQLAAQAPQMAGAVRDLAGADTSSDNALTKLLGNTGGPIAAAAVQR